MRKKIQFIFWVLSLLSAGGCSARLFAPVADLAQSSALVSLAVTPSAASLLVGGAQQLTATGTYADGSAHDVSSLVTWISTSPGIASVSPAGLATGISAGSATIAVSSWGFTASVSLSVAPLVTLANLHNLQAVETGFAIGTAHSGVAQVGCRFDGGTPFAATGVASWSCPLPKGTNTWKRGSRHGIEVGVLNGGSLSASTTISVVKANNKDLNGDGYPDFVVGAPVATGNTGIAYVYPGASTGISTTPSVTLPGHATEAFGSAIAEGDFNGDGYGDLAIGAYLSNLGSVYLYLGSNTGVSTVATTTLAGHAASESFGASVSLGDTNGDGYDDLLAGGPGNNSYVGAAYIYNGSSGGISAPATTTLIGHAASEQFGDLVYMGDTNGDGYTDLIVNAPVNSGNTGAVYLYNGSNTGVSTTATATFLGHAAAEHFGVASLGDSNGDGYADLVVGAYGNNGGVGAVYIYNGSSSGVSAVASTTLLGHGSEAFGGSIAVGDMNGDGFGDLAVGAGSGNATIGTVYLYAGTGGGFSGTASSSLPGEAAGDYFGSGSGVLALSDINGDGFADLLAGSRFNGTGGAAYLYEGMAGGSLTLSETLKLLGIVSGGWFGDVTSQ